MARLRGTDRVLRMLAIVPWIAAQSDGASIDDICERFAIDRSQLVEDLETVSMVGVAPYTPDLLVEVLIEDDRVWVTLPIAFDRPLRLTPDEGLSLLTAGSSLLSVPGADTGGPLARGLDRIAALLGVAPGDDIHIDLGQAEEDTLRVVRQAIADRRQLRLDYYSYGRDEHAARTVDPHRLWADAGQWYLAGYCHLAEDERIFRVDRMAAIELLDTESDRGAKGRGPLEGYVAGVDTPRIVIRLEPQARWVLEQYPIEVIDEQEDGSVRATIAVSAVPWLERLLLRLGPEARVERADAGLADAGPRAARRVLARYQ